MLAAHALALLLALAPLPPVTLSDADGHARQLGDGRVIIVVYEDQDGSKENARIKELLARVNASPQNRAHVEVVPVANVEKWSWWPARKYAVSEIRRAQEHNHTTVYIDWKGELRSSWGLKRNHSNLVLLGADRRPLWVSVGTLDAAQLDALLALLRGLGVST